MKNFLLYFLVVLIPAALVTIYFANDLNNHDEIKRIKNAQSAASIHEENWDNFISETVTILDMLSIAATTTLNTPEEIEPLLLKIQQSDPRYGGIYLLDKNGNVLTGSKILFNETNLSDRHYIVESIQTKDIIISNKSELLKNNQRVIGIAKPALDQNQSLSYIIVALLRADYLQNSTKMMTPEAQLYISNSNGEMIMQINHSGEIKKSDQYFSLPINNIPWEIHVKIPEKDKQQIRKRIIIFSLLSLILCHILYLLINYFILRRHTIQEKKQNELHKLELLGTFAASTAHEIRNPLTGIKGLIQLLSEKYTTKEDQKYFSIIDQEINRINEIVSEFLILGKPTAQKAEALNINAIITELEPFIQYDANSKRQKLQIILPESPMFVNCPKDQMKQIILNITRNAIESMDTDGLLTIQLKKQQDDCHLIITDTGKGISNKEMKKIFKPFFTSKDNGTGLGLVICKRILDSFGGDITISSKQNKGTAVTITLPIFNPSQ